MTMTTLATSRWSFVPKGIAKITYNSLGQLIKEEAADYRKQDGSAYGSITYAYDKNGNLIRKVDGNLRSRPVGVASDWHEYSTYDALDRVTETGIGYTYNGTNYHAPVHRFFYDQSFSALSRGRLSFALSIDLNSICNYAERYDYDSRGRVKKQVNYFNAVLDSSGGPNWQYSVQGDSVTIRYTYDWADQVRSLTYPDGLTVTYDYDNRGRLTAVGGTTTADSVKYAGIGYTHRNQIETMRLGGSLQQVDYAYNERGWLTSINNGSSAGGDLFGQRLYYDTSPPDAPSGWNPQYNGNLFGQTISMLGQDTTFIYRYDNTDRLREVQRGGNAFEAFTYDVNGNLLTRTKNSSTSYYSYTSGTNKAFRVNKPAPTLDDTLSYDQNGNVDQHTGKKASCHYDLFGQMDVTAIVGGLGADTVWYGYNVAGERIYKAFLYHYQKTCENQTSPAFRTGDTGPLDEPAEPTLCTFTAMAHTYYVLGQGRVLAEQAGVSPSATKFRFIYSGGNRIAMRDASNKLHFYLNDHLGSAGMVIDSTGLVKDKYWYYSFGESRNEQVSTNQLYRYTSKPLDKEGGLNIYYYGARYYDPELGRFWAVDPAAVSSPNWSPYAYCADNPVKNVDPSGESVDEFAGGVVGGVWEAILANAKAISDMALGMANPALAAQSNLALGGAVAQLAQDPLGTVGAVASQISSKWSSGDQGKGQIIGRALGEIGIAIAASKGMGALGKVGEASAAATDAATGVAKGQCVVYEGVDKARTVRYVGHTGQVPANRFSQNLRDVGSGKELLTYKVVEGAKGLSKTEARQWEQALIDKYGLQKNGGTLLNKINAIRKE